MVRRVRARAFAAQISTTRKFARQRDVRGYLNKLASPIVHPPLLLLHAPQSLHAPGSRVFLLTALSRHCRIQHLPAFNPSTSVRRPRSPQDVDWMIKINVPLPHGGIPTRRSTCLLSRPNSPNAKGIVPPPSPFANQIKFAAPQLASSSLHCLLESFIAAMIVLRDIAPPTLLPPNSLMPCSIVFICPALPRHAILVHIVPPFWRYASPSPCLQMARMLAPPLSTAHSAAK
jgi:hypothetical protein